MPDIFPLRTIHDDEGATAVEYAVILSLITAVIIISVSLLGLNTRNAFDKVNETLSPPGTSEDSSSTTTPPDPDDKCDGKDSEDDDDCGIGNDDKS